MDKQHTRAGRRGRRGEEGRGNKRRRNGVERRFVRRLSKTIGSITSFMRMGQPYFNYIVRNSVSCQCSLNAPRASPRRVRRPSIRLFVCQCECSAREEQRAGARSEENRCSTTVELQQSRSARPSDDCSLITRSRLAAPGSVDHSVLSLLIAARVSSRVSLLIQPCRRLPPLAS